MEINEKIRIIKESYESLRARKIVKTQNDFAELLGISAKSLSAGKNGVEGYCTDSLISKIQGVMKEYERQERVEPALLSQEEPQESLSALTPHFNEVRQVPTIPVHAYRAVDFDVMEYFKTTTDKLHLSPIVLQFPNTDCYFYVNSNEMSPELRTNDLLCLSRIPNEGRVTNGDIYILNTKYQGILGRFVYDDGDHYVLKSSQERWTDMRIPKAEVYSVFRILGGIRTNI